jgi:putative spermidine/putrescine transport system ATP-binding protein
VLIGLQSPDSAHDVSATASLSAMLSEDRFAAEPLAVGQSVWLSWAPEAAHPLPR